MPFHFYYDESEHSRKINLNTITADNYYDGFTAVIIGWKSDKEKEIEERYLQFEKKYADRKSHGELKSTTIRQKYLKYGFTSLKDDNVRLIGDFLDLFNDDIYIYFSVISKVEYIIRQVFSEYENSPLFDMDALKYSITKAVLTYRPPEVMECIYSNADDLPEKLSIFLQSRIEINNSNPLLKAAENQAFKEALIILKDAKGIQHEEWDYHAPFVGFQYFLTEQAIKDYSLTIDREGNDHKTLTAAKECGLFNVSENSSEETVGIRMADMLAGLISKLMRSCSEALRGSSDTPIKKTLLSQEWFKLDESRLKLYKKLYYVIMVLHDSWYKAFAGGYSDDLISFTSLLAYMNQFKNTDEIAQNLKMHGELFNTYVCNRLQEHFRQMRNKLPVEPVSPDTTEYVLNQKGAKVFLDPHKQPVLRISKSKCYDVLSVGVNKNLSPLVTINEEGHPVCYKLPAQLSEWATTLVALANTGQNIFPAKVMFSCKGGKYYADIF